MYRLGIDIGSVSVNVAVVNENGKVVKSQYIRHKGKPFVVAKEAIEEAAGAYEVEFIATTGTGAKVFASLVGAAFVNEIVAISRAMGKLYPSTGSVVDIGGEDSKLIVFEPSGRKGFPLRVKDFSMNALCAAGTGAFLDQQASRLRFTIEEFSEVALKARNIPRIAGRCTVFAKSDMIHLQQIATPDYEIVAGLCYALARNFKGNIAKGKDVRTPVAFIGGVAANAGMRTALREVFGLTDDTFFVPENFTSVGAAGAVYAVLEDPSLKVPFAGLDGLNAYLNEERQEATHEPLSLSAANMNVAYDMKPVTRGIKVYLGVDVGSISTNLVLIDQGRNVLAKRYLMTEGRPLEAVKRGLAEIGAEVGDMVEIIGAGTTGSGRYLTADFIGADIVRNEITAQAQAAIAIDPRVDTIFEIGGQDSKYISIDNGVIVDFEMNKACAAGTGSFLEEQAERLDISIKEEFGALALKSKRPVKMGERCTVFIESDVIHQQQRGAAREDIVSGLAYSIVQNYLNKVVVDRRVGRRIFFQGGTAFNKGVVAAFEKVLGMPITVPPHHDVTGAIGVAILAMKEKTWEKSGFKGFDLSKRSYTVETFECKGCENLCEIRKVTVENETPLYYGSRCEKYDVVRRGEKKEMADLFSMREEILNEIYDRKAGKPTIGIPKVLHMHELLPFWKSFLTELGFHVVVSDKTNKKTVRDGVENIIVESCFPIKLAHGHVMNLLQKGIDNIFIPSVISLSKPSKHARNSFACPYAQSLPYTIKGSINFDDRQARILTPIIRFGEGDEAVLANLVEHFKPFGKSKRSVRKAFEAARHVQDSFYRRLTEMGRAFLDEMRPDDKVMVVVGRPYNSADPGANLNIHKKLMNLGVPAIPMDMLPVNDVTEDSVDLEHMYWGYGQKILKAARAVKNNRNLYAIYVTSFGCGPDSFISHFFKRIMGNKPYLSLEIDEHSADAGIVTRLEAFLDSITNARFDDGIIERRTIPFEMDGRRRRIYVPYMSDHSHALAAAFRSCGVDAQVMKESTEETVLLGRKFTSGKECYPCILTTGDMLRTVRGEGFDPERSAFFMPSGEGPCRFGQYNRFHRMVLDEAGFAGVPIYAPNQDHRFYKEFNIVGGRFTRLGWRAVVSVDLLTKILHETRPYEKVPGTTDAVYAEALAAVCRCIETGAKDIDVVLKDVLGKFRAIECRQEKKPTIGLVGEIYIRSNKFSNSQLIRTVEDLGGVVWLAPVCEWISYVNYTGKRKSKKRDTLLGVLGFVITEYIQSKDEHLMEDIFVPFIKYGPEPKIKDILEKASPYIHDSFEGEAVLTVGKSVDFVHKGVAGIINAMPFTCMPGTVSSAIMKLIQQNHDIPVINIAYDGQGVTNILTRLEAFMHQVREHIRD
ncbi:MAG: Activator of (R)-2-hydroxyglutaryl-CoA dehydratase [Syntrophorhabdus sp. PtaB.Bin184]|nr:MAG: Activator of (R)-2-hydroxyglutaryl-CoA dehydratase [Syntrophorhabdus sp. PtaB.Bin184]